MLPALPQLFPAGIAPFRPQVDVHFHCPPEQPPRLIGPQRGIRPTPEDKTLRKKSTRRSRAPLNVLRLGGTAYTQPPVSRPPPANLNPPLSTPPPQSGIPPPPKPPGGGGGKFKRNVAIPSRTKVARFAREFACDQGSSTVESALKFAFNAPPQHVLACSISERPPQPEPPLITAMKPRPPTRNSSQQATALLNHHRPAAPEHNCRPPPLVVQNEKLFCLTACPR